MSSENYFTEPLQRFIQEKNTKVCVVVQEPSLINSINKDDYNEVMDASDYFLKFALGLTKKEAYENGWNLFDSVGFCGYKEGKIYIGYPYLNNSLPLERALIHEQGHLLQDTILKANITNCNTTILEYHNIMMNENQSNVDFPDNSRLGYKNLRYTYKDNVTQCISEIKFKQGAYHPIELNPEFHSGLSEKIASKCKPEEQSKSKEFFDQMYEKTLQEQTTFPKSPNFPENINRILFLNMCIELGIH